MSLELNQYDRPNKKKKQTKKTINHPLMPRINALNPPPPLPVVPSWEGAPLRREDTGAVGPGPARGEQWDSLGLRGCKIQRASQQRHTAQPSLGTLQGSGPVLPGKPTRGAETLCSLLEQADIAG